MIALGPFKLDKPLGKGGMGEVWRGYHVKQNFPVAIKVLSPETRNRPAYVEAFHTEVKAMASLDHPAIISVMDYGFISEKTSQASHNYFLANSPYLVMELGEGGSLDHWMDRLNWIDTQSILLTVLDALAHSHAHGVIHRDLKPQNLLLGFKDNVVKLTDFGLSHLHHDTSREGRFETVWGTPAYMAPEQIRGSWRDYGPWTDLYALGCMAYELVTGQPPFLADEPADIWYAHMQEPLPRWKPRFPIPAQLERWVATLLQKEPHKRFQRAADAAYALMKICNYSRPTQALNTQTFSTVAPVTLTLEASFMTHRQEANQPPLHNLMTQRLEPQRRLALDKLQSPTIQEPPYHDLIDISDTQTLNTLDWSSYAEDSHHSLLELSDIPLEELEPWPLHRPPFPSTWRRNNVPIPSPRLLGTGIHLFKLKTPRMVGRSQESEKIWQEIKTSCVLGQPRIVLIQGPSGIGKSRLMKGLAARTHELGACEVLYASYSQQDSAKDGLLPMLTRHIQSNKLGFRDGMIRTAQFLKHYPQTPTEHFKQLGHVLFEHAEDYPHPTSVDQSMMHLHNFQVILEHMRYLAKERPVVICIDDIHWGAEGLLFMRFAMRFASETPHLPICFIITTRQNQAQENFLERQLIDELIEYPATTTIDMNTLKAQHFNELLSQLLPLSPALAHEVEQRAQGIPLFAIQLIGSWVDNDRLIDEPDGFVLKPGNDHLPDNIHQLMQDELKELDEHLHIPLLIAAALGGEVQEHEWLHALTDYLQSLPPFLLTKMADSGIIYLTHPQVWSFSHNIMRESLIRDAKERGIWVEINKTCAGMVLDLYPKNESRYERLAHFFFEANLHQDALNTLILAARYELIQGNGAGCQQTIERFNQIAASVNLSHKAPILSSLHNMRALLLLQQGAPLKAQLEAQHAYSLSKLHQQHLHMLQATEHIIEATLGLGDTASCAPWLEELLRLAHLTGHSRSLRQHALLSAQSALAQGLLTQARDLATEALLDAQTHDDQEHIAQSMMLIGRCFHLRLRHEHAKDNLERAYKVARKLKPRHLSARCLLYLGDARRELGKPDTAVNFIQRAMGLFKKHESDQVYIAALRQLILDLQAQQWINVESQLESLLKHFRQTNERPQLALAIALEIAIQTHKSSWIAAGDALIELKGLRDYSDPLRVEIAACIKLTIEQAPDTCPPAFRHDLRVTMRDLHDFKQDQELSEITLSHISS